MANKAYIKLWRSVAVLFSLAQFALMMPHHHHEGSNAPCLNIVHCLTDISSGHGCDQSGNLSGCHGNCSHDHDPVAHDHGGRADNCSFSSVDIIHPDRDENISDLGSAVIDLLCEAVILTGDHITESNYRHSLLSYLDYVRCDAFIPLHISYISSALPPRAPSFTV